MKPIDILVQELPKRGGWPDKSLALGSYGVKGAGTFYFSHSFGDYIHVLGCETVTREQYESELAASKIQQWDGVGLPPVGFEVEVFVDGHAKNPTCPPNGTVVTVVSHQKTSDGNKIAVVYWDENGGGRSECLIPECLRPIRTEEDRKREDAEVALTFILTSLPRYQHVTEWSSAIIGKIAEGKIPGVYIK